MFGDDDLFLILYIFLNCKFVYGVVIICENLFCLSFGCICVPVRSLFQHLDYFRFDRNLVYYVDFKNKELCDPLQRFYKNLATLYIGSRS